MNLQDYNNNNIKCFILYNEYCAVCDDFFESRFENLKQEIDIQWIKVNCTEEHENGCMPFPPIVAPSFYFYKNIKDFPLICQGLFPEPEFTRTLKKAVEKLK
jgi:hypothetical protein